MPAIGNIVINDGATTPVAHTFKPVKQEGTLSTYADNVGGVPIGNPVITIALREPSNAGGVYKGTVKILFPVLELTSPSTATGIQPAPTVAYTVACHMDFLLPARSTTQNRKDLLAFVKNFLANGVSDSVLRDLENVY